MGTLRLKYSKKLIEEEQQKAAGSLEKLEKERETKLSKDVTSSDIGELDQQIAKQEVMSKMRPRQNHLSFFLRIHKS